ncbi:hypothetical protein OS670_13305 [Pseudomonadaceae bacterium T75]|uniref:hypothetical protein n=1 Tax=Stutzerimonas nitrititolerans TaxID=2482751 RepID=UPI00226F7EB5|nr:hypothetical protein [Stutzerimonas nitrititolerans]WAD25395.1 hypothetical protein OS670_13305 [Pseudomonadaceae bacterium T75]
MTKTEFLALEQTERFVGWFAEIINGDRPLMFCHERGTDTSLRAALSRYAWPNKRIDIATPKGMLSIKAWSNFGVNEAVLNELADGINACLKQRSPDNQELAGWIRAIMVWGGVFTRSGKNQAKGNAGWLDEHTPHLTAYIRNALDALKGDDDISHLNMKNLRSNAGTTKVHSLTLPNFVIYDSRVAAALAWLVRRWAIESEEIVPEHLRFACMRAKTSKTVLKRRSPDEKVFRYFAPTGHFRSHHKHALWNIRANWIVQAAIAQAQANDWSSRKVEAALFMMGDELSLSLKA